MYGGVWEVAGGACVFVWWGVDVATRVYVWLGPQQAAFRGRPDFN